MIESPPRLRGLLTSLTIPIIAVRITPALAGTTLHQTTLAAYFQDHPRACGDYLGKVGQVLRFLGSPPRLRGLLTSLTIPIIAVRITPALAGTTLQRQNFCLHSRDHPRACGDYLAKTYQNLNHSGSPPRLRGLL